MYNHNSSVHIQVVDTLEKEKETASALKKKNLDAQIKVHQKNITYCMSRMAKARQLSQLV